MTPPNDAGQAPAVETRPVQEVQRITVKQYVEEKWSRRTDVEAFLMYSPLQTGSRVWRVTDVLPGFPLEPDSIRPSIVWFDYTDHFKRRRRGTHSVKADDEIVVVFRLKEGVQS